MGARQSLPNLHGAVGQVGVHTGAVRAHGLFVLASPGLGQQPYNLPGQVAPPPYPLVIAPASNTS